MPLKFFSISKIEIEQLLKAWIIISIAFAIVHSGGISGIINFNIFEFTILFVLSAITIGLGFILHELGHKLVAQKYKCWAEFRYDIQMLVVALVLSLFQFLFVAPGAVIIHGHLTESKYGKISLAGPLVNIVLAILFLILSFISPLQLISMVFRFGFEINIWIGLFNLLPFMNFDGAKILRWNKAVYFSVVSITGFLMVLSYYYI
ncbi:hypothetical protein JXB41_07290 [Candidatus Woesearchaeota archaeon]|nr:hypothetical protein [Candidatus Woesearchaeota archaeon]